MKKEMNKDKNEFMQNFSEVQVNLKNKVAMDRFKELENAIDDRVHVSKFRILEKNVTDYMKKEEFKAFKVNQDQILADMYVKIKSLASTLSVDSKVQAVKDEFENLSLKEDCCRDKEEAMRAGNSLRHLFLQMRIAHDQLHEDVQK